MDIDINKLKAVALQLDIPAAKIDALINGVVDDPSSIEGLFDSEGEDGGSPSDELMEEKEEKVKVTYSTYAVVSFLPDSGVSAEALRDLSIKIVQLPEELPGNDIPSAIDSGASIYNDSKKGQKDPLHGRFDALEMCTNKQFVDTGLKVYKKKDDITVIPILNEIGSRSVR